MDMETECALRGIIVGDALRNMDVKLGSEGLIAHWNEALEIVRDSFKKFPLDYDWEAHDGEDWDVEILEFTEAWVFEKYYSDDFRKWSDMR